MRHPVDTKRTDRDIGKADRVAIHGRLIEGGEIARSNDRLGQNTPKRFIERHRFAAVDWTDETQSPKASGFEGLHAQSDGPGGVCHVKGHVATSSLTGSTASRMARIAARLGSSARFMMPTS